MRLVFLLGGLRLPLVLLLGGLLLLPGCGPRGAAATGREGSGASPASAPGRTVLRFWNGFTGPDGRTMERMVRRFQEQNPDVLVRMQIIPWSTYYDKLTLALAYGGAPDVFVLHAGRLPEFASFDTLRPLDDLLARSQPPLGERDFAPVPWRASFYNGRQLALPLDVHPIGLYYNTRLFEQAGIVDANGRAQPPATWDAFLDAARRLTRDTDGDGRPDQWGFVFTWQRSNWMTFAAQFGGAVLTPDGRRCAMDAPQSLAATRRMHDLIYKYKVAPKPEGVDAWLAFRQGRVGMALEGIYMLASLEEQKGLPYAGAPAPQFGPRRAVWGGSHLLCQPASIPPGQAAAAWRLMRFLSDHSLAWAEGGQVPARTAIMQSAAFAALPVPAQFGRQLSFIQYDPLTPRMNALFQFVDPAIEAVLLDLESPERAMGDACRRINQVLARP
jgi:multiple sugar transport system substrate-binding protein